MLEITKRIALSVAALPLLLAALPARAETDISIMTQNEYLGTDLAPLLRAPDAATFNTALVTALTEVASSDFPRRAERMAKLIAKRKPHLVAAQEVWYFQCVDLAPPADGYGCSHPSIADAFNDQLSVMLSALAAQGAIYHAVGVVENLDLRDITVEGLPAGVPFYINGVPALLLALDRDVILVRNDIFAAGNASPAPIPCALPSVNGCNFQAFVEAVTPAGPLAVNRGFVGVDATIDDKDYRFVNTHLEVHQPDPSNPVSSFFQAAQAAELIQTLALTTPMDRTLIVAGDINSSPDHTGVPGPLPLPPPFDAGILPPYMQFAYSGYVDTWTAQPEPTDGFTCCQLPDLSNTANLLNERIDVIFTRDVPVSVSDVEVVGDRATDKTPSPEPALWPSDHGSVTAEILY